MSEQVMISDDKLIELAKEARKRSHSPYSGFAVGSALLAADGRIFTGCNIENSSFSLTMCAERVALFKAASEGVRRIVKIAVVADHEKLTPPCGCCRQMIWEFAAGAVDVILANLSGRIQRVPIGELFPEAFDSTFLEPANTLK